MENLIHRIRVQIYYAKSKFGFDYDYIIVINPKDKIRLIDYMNETIMLSGECDYNGNFFMMGYDVITDDRVTENYFTLSQIIK